MAQAAAAAKTGILLFPDYLIIGAYVALVILLGLFLKRKITGAKDYFAAGSTMPWWVAGCSYFMASFSTMLFIIYCEIAYTMGFVAFTITWVSGATMIIAGAVMSHRWRRARVMTPMGFMERRYSKSIYQLFVWLGFPLRLLDNGMRIYGISLVCIVAIFGVGIVKDIDTNRQILYYAILAMGMLFITYSLLGGQSAVMITDFVQAIILLVTVCLITWQCLPRDAVGTIDWSIFKATVPANHMDWFQPSKVKGYDWFYLTFNIFLISTLNNAAGWALVQKYNCVRSEADARKMVWLVVFLKAISPPIFFLPGLAAFYLMTPAEIGSNSRYVFALVSFKVLPVGLAGLMMLAMLGSAFSAMGAEYNTLSGVLTRDFFKRILRPQASAAQEVNFGRIATFIIGVVTLLVAITFDYYRELNLMDLMVRFFSVLGPPVMIPMFLGLLTKKVTSRGVWCGVILGVTIGSIAAIINLVLVKKYAIQMKTDAELDWQLRTLFGAMISLGTVLLVILGIVVGSMSPRSAEEEASVNAFFEDLKKPYLIDRKNKAAVSPFKLIGMLAFCFGLVMLAVTTLIFIMNAKYNVPTFRLHLLVAVVMCGLGALMWWRSSRPEPETIEPEPKVEIPVGAGRD